MGRNVHRNKMISISFLTYKLDMSQSDQNVIKDKFANYLIMLIDNNDDNIEVH